MSRFIDLAHQVAGMLSKSLGGTGNRHGYGTALVQQHANQSDTDALPLGTLVMLSGTTLVEPTDTLDSEDVHGVVIGYYRQSDMRLIEDDCPAAGLCAVMVRGQCKALIDADVDNRDYAYASGTTDGYGYGNATLATGAFGRWQANGRLASGIDLIPIQVGLIGGGGGGSTGGFTDASVEATFDLPTGGDEIWTRVPWDMTITGWELSGDDAGGSAEVDVWVGAYLPTVADTITASDLPTLTTDDDATGAATGWTTGLTKGDWMMFHVNSVTGHQRLVVNVFGDRAS